MAGRLSHKKKNAWVPPPPPQCLSGARRGSRRRAPSRGGASLATATPATGVCAAAAPPALRFVRSVDRGSDNIGRAVGARLSWLAGCRGPSRGLATLPAGTWLDQVGPGWAARAPGARCCSRRVPAAPFNLLCRWGSLAAITVHGCPYAAGVTWLMFALGVLKGKTYLICQSFCHVLTVVHRSQAYSVVRLLSEFISSSRPRSFVSPIDLRWSCVSGIASRSSTVFAPAVSRYVVY